MVARLLGAAGQTLEAAVQKRELARQRDEKGDPEGAAALLEQAMVDARSLSGHRDGDCLFILTVLDISNLRYRLGRNQGDIPGLLQEARAAANRLGDRRSLALIGLHLGRIYYVTDRLDEALKILKPGLEVAVELGDDDIQMQAAEFRGLYYYLQGLYGNAAEHFDRAVQISRSGERRFFNELIPAYLAFCSANLGQFHRAIGIIDFDRRRAARRSEFALAGHFQAVLGIILLMAGRDSDAVFHLECAGKLAASHGTTLASYIAGSGLAYQAFLDGRIRESYDCAHNAVSELIDRGITIRQYPGALLLDRRPRS